MASDAVLADIVFTFISGMPSSNVLKLNNCVRILGVLDLTAVSVDASTTHISLVFLSLKSETRLILALTEVLCLFSSVFAFLCSEVLNFEN